jgi:hypothetical protein|tara:strand:+ start:2365 stop:3000 length:636 start_codon:yes stop_codon:yes gene_type:complete
MPRYRKKTTEASGFALKIRKKERTKRRVSDIVPDASLLLCPNVPKPMHGIAPRVVLGGPWWEAERQAAFKSSLWCCEACGVHKEKAKARQWMEGHEFYDIDYLEGKMFYVRTVSLCHYCHNFIHDGRLHGLLRQNKIHHGKFVAILQHGDKVLADAGLQRMSRRARDTFVETMKQNGTLALWHAWRLVVEGKEYLPRYRTEQEADEAYKRA